METTLTPKKPTIDYTFMFALLHNLAHIEIIDETSQDNDIAFQETVFVKLDAAGKRLFDWCIVHGYKVVQKHDWFTVVDYLDEFNEYNSCLAITALFSRGFKTNN